MRKFTSDLAFQLWIGLAKRIILAVDGVRYGAPPDIAGQAQPCRIASGNRMLAALYAFAEDTDATSAAVLIFHGIGDRMEYWANAQKLLLRQGIPSLIFDYSGYGESTGETTPGNLHADAQAAYGYLRSRLSPETPIFLLAFSLGTGLATEAAPTLRPAPAGLILVQPFTSLQLAAGEVVRPLRALRYLFPDLWRTVDTIAKPICPLLILHGDGDELFPVTMGRAIHAQALQAGVHPVEFASPPGLCHNAIYLQTPPDYWQPIVDFIQRYSQPHPLD